MENFKQAIRRGLRIFHLPQQAENRKKQKDMETLLLMAGVILLSAGVVMAFRSASSGAACAYLGLTALCDSHYVAVSSSELLYWAIAVLIILFIGWNRSVGQPVPGVCRNYIVGGALAGMMAGVTLGHVAMIMGSVIGAAVGGVAYGRTASGMVAVGRRLWRVIVEIGLPAVVTMILAGMALEGVLDR